MNKKTPVTKKAPRKKPVRAADDGPVPSEPSVPVEAAKPAPAPAPATMAWSEQQKERKAARAALIAVGPREALFVAKDNLEQALALFYDLIDSRLVYHPYESEEGADELSHDDAERCLRAAFVELVGQIVKRARAGSNDFIAATWIAAHAFTTAIHDLSFNKATARKLQSMTRQALFLPSLRARQGTFTHDFQTVADALRLSEDCLCNMDDNAPHRLDSPVTFLIAQVVEDVEWNQRFVRGHRDGPVVSDKQSAKSGPSQGALKELVARARSSEAKIEEQYLLARSCSPIDLQSEALPPLTKATADEWWTKAVRREVTRRFRSMKGTRLYALLNGNKPHEKLDDLRRRGKKALRSLARADPQDPHPS